MIFVVTFDTLLGAILPLLKIAIVTHKRRTVNVEARSRGTGLSRLIAEGALLIRIPARH
jgi:hypothetical protein